MPDLKLTFTVMPPPPGAFPFSFPVRLRAKGAVNQYDLLRRPQGDGKLCIDGVPWCEANSRLLLTFATSDQGEAFCRAWETVG